MSVFLTPEGKPFYGGTFFWQEQFLKLLAGISQTWKNERKQIEESAAGLTKALNASLTPAKEVELSKEIFKRALLEFSSRFDAENGGFGEAPKFPPATSIMLLLRIYSSSKDERALEMACETLDKMACGGIYDHLGGGFHRYTTDSAWLIPHFEKMLYDNALIIRCYLEAYQLTKNEIYVDVARASLNYVMREMSNEEGGILFSRRRRRRWKRRRVLCLD